MSTPKVHISELYNSLHVLGKISETPELITGQSALAISDGTIPGTTNGVLYLFRFGDTPVDLTSEDGTTYEDLATSAATNPDADVDVSDFNLNTGGAVALTLADPSMPSLGNSQKTIIISRFTAGSSLTMNIDNLVGGSGISYNAVGQSTVLMWSAAGWAIIGGAGGSVF